MSSRIFSIITGIALILFVGSFVFATKKPYVDVSQQALDSSKNLESTSTGSNTNKNSSIKQTLTSEKSRENEEDDDDGNTSSNSSVPQTSTNQSSGTSQNTFTLSQISTHNSRSSCWSVINGSVYDLTSWIPKHPGGEQAILALCGINGTSMYNNQHGGSSRPAMILAGFKIGVVAN